MTREVKTRALYQIISLVGLVAATAANAVTPPPAEGSDPLFWCYFQKSIVYGVSKCDPPSLLVGAVFGACFKEEENMRQQIMVEYGPDRIAVVDTAMARIHRRMSPVIQSWILETQVDGSPACGK